MLQDLLNRLKVLLGMQPGSTDSIMASFHKNIAKLESAVQQHTDYAALQEKIAADAQKVKDASLAEVEKAKEAANKLKAIVGSL